MLRLLVFFFLLLALTLVIRVSANGIAGEPADLPQQRPAKNYAFDNVAL